MHLCICVLGLCAMGTCLVHVDMCPCLGSPFLPFLALASSLFILPVSLLASGHSTPISPLQSIIAQGLENWAQGHVEEQVAVFSSHTMSPSGSQDRS